MEASLYGLTPSNAQCIEYKYCEENGISHTLPYSQSRAFFKKFSLGDNVILIRSGPDNGRTSCGRRTAGGVGVDSVGDRPLPLKGVRGCHPRENFENF